MEFITIFAEMLLDNIKILPPREIDKKEMRVYGSMLFSIAMILGVGLSSYFLIDSFQAGLLFKSYLLVGLGINAITSVSVVIILYQLWNWKTDTHIQESEGFLQSELRSLIDIFLLSLIPGLHIILLPRVVAQAKNLIARFDHISTINRYVKIAGNLLSISMLAIMTYALIFGMVMIIAGDTRK